MNRITTKLRESAAGLLLASWLLGPSLILYSSCSTPTIAPGGDYSGDPFLVGVDESLVQSKAELGGFLSWLQQNRDLLAKNNMSVLVAGERIRTNAPLWFTNAYALRGAFIAARTDLNSNLLNGAISQLQAQAASTTAITNSIKP